MDESMMKTTTLTSLENKAPSTPVLALRPRAAAKALGIGERLLWTLTKSGEIPHARIRKAVVYPVDQLREYLRRKTKECADGER